MRQRRHCIVPLLAWLVAMVPLSAHASTFCVNSATSLQAALNTAGTNNQADLIEIVAGTYTAPPGGFFYISSEANGIDIYGGYTSGCTQRTAARTTLDGSGLYQIMRIILNASSTAVNIDIRRITFIDGKATTSGGGLMLSALNGYVNLEANRFLLNHADISAGALYVESGGIVVLRSNLFFANDASDEGAAMLLTSNAEAYVVGNTVVSNTATSSLPMTHVGGVYFAGEAGTHLELSNNIFWNNNPNGIVDFESGTPFTARNNDIGIMAGVPPDALSQGNQSVDPQFAPCGSLLCVGFNLLRASPLVDAGYDAAPGGLGALDLEDKPRIIGPHVDIGAYEEDVLFRNGFE